MKVYAHVLKYTGQGDSQINSLGKFNSMGLHVFTDPTYMIRAIPSNASDNIYCTLLAQSAVHGAMAGFSGFTVGPVNSRHAYIPISVRPFSHISLHAFYFILFLN